MNCTYEKYLYIYNIKIMEENTLLIKKKSNMFFLFFRTKTIFQNSILKHNFFLKKNTKYCS